MKNKVLALTSCLMLFYGFANAQRLEKDEVDKFTKEQVRETGYENIWRNAMMGGLIEAKVKSSNGDMTLWLNLHLTSSFIVMSDNKIYLLLQNDSSIALKSIAGTVGKPTKHVWHGQVGYLITPEDAKFLRASPLKAIRIDFAGNYDTYNIKERNSSTITDMLKLVQQ